MSQGQCKQRGLHCRLCLRDHLVIHSTERGEMRSWIQKGREREGSLSEINPPTALTRKCSSGNALRSLSPKVMSFRRDLMAIRLTC